MRLQAELRSASGVSRYKGTLDAYSTIVRTEGVSGLYRGIVPNIMRNSLMNMAELATYDTAKQTLLRRFGLSDGLFVHIGSGAVLSTRCRVVAVRPSGGACVSGGATMLLLLVLLLLLLLLLPTPPRPPLLCCQPLHSHCPRIFDLLGDYLTTCVAVCMSWWSSDC